MQRLVERTDFVPDPVELRRQRVRRHVVCRAPHRSVSAKPSSRAPGIGQLDETPIRRPSGSRGTAPSQPGVEPLIRLPAFREQPFESRTIEACPALHRTGGTAVVRPLDSGEDVRQLLLELRAAGPTAASEVRRSRIFRRRDALSSTPSKRAVARASRAIPSSLSRRAAAAISAVSSVAKRWSVQAARRSALQRSSRLSSAAATNVSASAAVNGGSRALQAPPAADRQTGRRERAQPAGAAGVMETIWRVGTAPAAASPAIIAPAGSARTGPGRDLSARRRCAAPPRS